MLFLGPQAGCSCLLVNIVAVLRFDAMDVDFLEQVEALGLKAEEVWEPGVVPPPPSPPPFSELYPEQRIAVYKISPCG
jgi:hypothetical protein